MTQRSLKIIVVLSFLNLSATLKAQENISVVENEPSLSPNDHDNKIGKKFSQIQAKKTPLTLFTLSFIDINASTYNPLASNLTPTPALSIAGYYTQTLGFICWQELMLDRMTSINFRLRLGSPDQVDRLEGKFKASSFR